MRRNPPSRLVWRWSDGMGKRSSKGIPMVELKFWATRSRWKRLSHQGHPTTAVHLQININEFAVSRDEYSRYRAMNKCDRG